MEVLLGGDVASAQMLTLVMAVELGGTCPLAYRQPCATPMQPSNILRNFRTGGPCGGPLPGRCEEELLRR